MICGGNQKFEISTKIQELAQFSSIYADKGMIFYIFFDWIELRF